MTKEERLKIITDFGGSEKNTGLTEVQIALLTHDIKAKTAHCKAHAKDITCNRALLRVVAQRSRMLNYLKGIDVARYKAICEKLGIRK